MYNSNRVGNMSPTEGLLVIAVLIMIYLIAKRPKESADTRTKEFDCVNKETGDTTNVKMQWATSPPVAQTPEMAALAQNIEHFSACVSSGMTDSSPGCEGSFSDNSEYGASGMDYKSWVTSQAVDTQVMVNHAEFVKDRTSTTGGNIVGKTFSPDSHDSYDPQPWIGLRRPQAIQGYCNPTQVADMDINLFDKSPKFTWKSS